MRYKGRASSGCFLIHHSENQAVPLFTMKIVATKQHPLKVHDSSNFQRLLRETRPAHAANSLLLGDTGYSPEGVHRSWRYCNTRSMRGVDGASSYSNSLLQKSI